VMDVSGRRTTIAGKQQEASMFSLRVVIKYSR